MKRVKLGMGYSRMNVMIYRDNCLGNRVDRCDGACNEGRRDLSEKSENPKREKEIWKRLTS